MIFMCGHHTIINIILVPFNVCERDNILDIATQLHNLSGYVYCTGPNKGIKQMCPPGTEVLYVSYRVSGCVNKTSKYKTQSYFDLKSFVLF
jgi:hypothetical protein